jgi:hypothetical protein
MNQTINTSDIGEKIMGTSIHEILAVSSVAFLARKRRLPGLHAVSLSFEHENAALIQSRPWGRSTGAEFKNEDHGTYCIILVSYIL